MAKTSVSIPDDLWALAKLCHPHDKSVSAVVQTALQEFVQNHATEDNIEDLLAPWREELISKFIKKGAK